MEMQLYYALPYEVYYDIVAGARAHHDGCSQLQVKVTFDALLGHSLGNALGLSALKLPGQQIAQPALQQGHHPSQEEQPHTPHGRPEAHAWALAYWARVEPVVDQMFQILQHQLPPQRAELQAR